MPYNVIIYVYLNVKQIISSVLDSLNKKINTLHEDFQIFKIEMKQEAARNKRKLQEILAILREKFPRNEEADEITADLMPEFPLTSVEEYLQFNDVLKNDEAIRKCFVSIFFELY